MAGVIPVGAMLAAEDGHTETFRVVLEARADMEVKERFQDRTAVYRASSYAEKVPKAGFRALDSL